MLASLWRERAPLAGRGVLLAVPLGFALALLTVLYPLPGMALALAMGAVLLLTRRPEWLLLGFVLSLAVPLQKSLAGVPLNAADALLVLWCLLWPLLLLREQAPQFSGPRVPTLVWAITPFVLAVMLAQVGSIAQGNSLKQMFRVIEWFVVLPLLLLVFRPTAGFRQFAALSLLLVPCLFAIDGLYELASNGTRLSGMLGIGVPLPEGDSGQIRHTFDVSGRAGSTFGGAQGLAMYLVMTMSVAIAHLLCARQSGMRVLAGLCLLVCLAGLAASKSRGGLLGALALLLVMLVTLHPRLLLWLLLLAVFGCLVGVLTLALLPNWDGTLAGLVPGRPEAVLDRLIIWGVVFDVFRDNPLFGVGLGNFRDEFFARGVTLHVELGYPSLHAHNTYLELLADTGLCGLLSYLAFVLLVARALGRRWQQRSSDDGGLFSLAALGTLAAYLVFAMVDMLLLQNMHFLLVLILSFGLMHERAAAVGLAPATMEVQR